MFKPSPQANASPEPEKPSFEKAPESQAAPEPETQKPEQAQTEKEVKPEIPETAKPEIPKEEGIPKGGPGNQTSQTQAQATTQKTTQTSDQIKKEKAHKIKGQLSIKIPNDTPEERKISGQLEDWHSNNILNQP